LRWIRAAGGRRELRRRRHIAVDHPDARVGYAVFLDAFSSADDAFCNGITNQLIGLTYHRYEFEQPELNYLVAIINGIRPRDELEAILAAQMAAVHVAIMLTGKRLVSSTPPMQDGFERALNRLTRTFTAQLEALKHAAARAHEFVRFLPRATEPTKTACAVK
jgi:hypothetical protein